jgi:FkbM family methyltransferase
MPGFTETILKLPILKRLYPSLRKRWAEIFWKDGFAVVRSNGALFLVNHRNFVDRQIAFYGDYEAEQTAYLTTAMGEHGCDLFLDIGANIGLYSIRAAMASHAKQTVAFEPDPRKRNQFAANILMNGLTDQIEVDPHAVSNRSGPVGFTFFPETSTGQSRVDESGGTASVEAVRIDDVIDLKDGTIFAKIDIEGHEAAAVEGMAETIKANRVFLQIESFPEQLENLTNLLTRHGFTHRHGIGDDHFFANF